MKITQPTLLAGLLPLLTPLATLAQAPAESQNVASNVTDPKADTRLASAWWASDVIGTDVKNAAGESIGDVNDLVVNLKTGQILAVVISSGGFLGMADTLSSVPTTALRFDATAKAFKTDLTKDQLQRAPQHKSTERPDYSDTKVMGKLREFRDSIGGDVSAPDNTAKNEVDAKEETLTPVDQGSSDSDMKTTKDIRAAVVKEDNLSFNAKNIKIITKDGHVTLRGVVDSAAEHEAVIGVVTRHVDKAHITDSITVK